MIKHFNKILVCLLFFISCFSQAQINLVPNPSFEDTVACPNNQGQASYAIGWYETGSADYFNICSVNANFSVPYNWGGYQQPASGNAYCALSIYADREYCPNCREYIGTNLNSPLLIGTKYFVSFKVNLSLMNSLQVNCASNNQGALFSTQQLNISNPLPITYNPQINSANRITDTVNWVRISGSFVADSVYAYILLGNFFQDASTDTLIMNGSNLCDAYYFIDDICVSTDSLFAAHYSYIGLGLINIEKSVRIFPNPTTSYALVQNNSNLVMDCEIYDELSKKIKSFYLEPYSEMEIDLSNFSSGIYCFTAKIQNNILTKKIVKQ
jgi:hypothetical protein